MYKAARKIHLWVGLVLALVILAEALTGLILAEPWIAGQDKARPPQSAGMQGSPEQGKVLASTEKPGVEQARPGSDGGSIVGFARGLHQGRVGGFDLKWLVDLTAAGLIILVLTGVFISAPALRVRNRS